MSRYNLNTVLVEIRWRFFYFIISWSFFFILSFFFKEKISYIFLKYFLLNMNTHRFIFYNLIDVLWFYIKICLLFSFICYFLIFFIYITLFIKKSLVKIEYEIWLTCLILIFLGFISANLIIFKFIIFLFSKFFIEFENTSGFFELHWEASLNNIASLYLFLWSGISTLMQVPFLLYILVVFNKLKITSILTKRKLIFLSLLFITALILNTDFISQILLSILLYFLYESFILFYFILKSLITNSSV